MHKLQWLRTRAFSSKVVRSQVYICWNFSARCSCVYWRTKDGKESVPLKHSNMMSVFQDFKRFSWSFMNKGLALAKWKPSIHLRVSSFYLYIFLGWDHPVTQVNFGAKQSVLLENNVFFSFWNTLNEFITKYKVEQFLYIILLIFSFLNAFKTWS